MNPSTGHGMFPWLASWCMVQYARSGGQVVSVSCSMAPWSHLLLLLLLPLSQEQELELRHGNIVVPNMLAKPSDWDLYHRWLIYIKDQQEGDIW